MNFTDTFKSVELVLKAGEVPLLVGETGIGKTSLARELAAKNDWSLVGIDGNLLKEGEIGGLPTVEAGTTIYAVHHKLRKIDEEIAKGRTVLLFIDEINRCDHAVQQELMNLILNREINGYVLSPSVHIIAAMNPADSYDYEVVEMDAAQQNRFVWLYMEADYLQWLDWASTAGIEEKVMEFISTFPEYLDKTNEDDINATPRSYERISKLYHIYKQDPSAIPQGVFYNVIRGNVGKLIAQEFVHFVTSDAQPLIAYDDVFGSLSLDPALSSRVNRNMAVAFRNSIIVVVVVLVVTTIIGTMLAYVLSRFQFPGNGLIRGMFALAALLPGIAMQVALYKMMVNFHAVNTMWGYIVMMCGTDVISIYVFIQFFENISTSLDEAAIMDGASYFTVYYKILLPLLKPAIVTCAILKGVGVYNEYYAANLYLQDANLKTIAIALYSFTGPMGSKYNLICAGVIITLLPMLILFLIFQKQIYSGIAAGSVKE